MILSTFFGQNAKSDILTGGKISKNSPPEVGFSVYRCDDPKICENEFDQLSLVKKPY